MKKNFFGEKAGSYVINDAPLIGEYEYYYTNDNVLVKVDQFGINSIQKDPPADVALIKRETGGKISPWRVFFGYLDKVYHNFDFISATSHRIEFNPVSGLYELDFDGIKVVTEILVAKKGCRVIMRTTFVNDKDETISLDVMPYVLPYVNDLMMAPWDKPEWYTKTSVIRAEKNVFTTDRYSVSGDVKQRRYAHCVMDEGATALDISSERVFESTRNFSDLSKICDVNETENGLYAFQQAYCATYKISLKPSESRVFTQVLALTPEKEEVLEQIEISKSFFNQKVIDNEKEELNAFYSELFSKNGVKTGDSDFDSFINAFLPLELYWVAKLDRGWPTGMRGVRDASNDFMGLLSYDLSGCREIIVRLLSCQRSDGWFPRQIPMKDGKFDLRPFMDGGNFVIEFIYHYLTYSHDFSLLNEILPYYDSDKTDTAYTHIIKGLDFYLQDENIGEHGLCKIKGGDWLDTLSGAGLLGRGESVMVTCQLIMSLNYLIEINKNVSDELKFSDEKCSLYLDRVQELKKNVNKYSLNEKGFYNAVFTDNGEWIFSDCDPDGETRPYTPTNAYAITSGVCDKADSVIENLKGLKSEHGYRLFYPAMGKKRIDLIGKMGTGDLQAGFGENGNPYNHGSHGFLLRALAKVGDYRTFYDVLNYMMPFNPEFHSPESSRSAPYAIINVYQSVPMFNGRAGFSFLTGSVAMLYRAIYHWMAGVQFTFDGITVNPCLPKEFSGMNFYVSLANGKKVEFELVGYGNRIVSSSLGKVVGSVAKISTEDLNNADKIRLVLGE